MSGEGILYKYVPACRVDVLTRGLVRFSPPRDLNDPFESRPVVRANRTSVIRRLHRECRDPHVIAQKSGEFEAYVAAQGTQVLWDQVNSLFGVLSLSEDPVHPVMWGHYADSYRGFVIGFDASHEWLASRSGATDITRTVQPVTYTSERPVVEVGEGNDHDREAFAKGAILTKHRAWAFEKEWRMLRASAEALPATECAGVSNLFEFPVDMPVEVVLGPRMRGEDTEALVAVLGGGRYPMAQLKRLILPDTSYDLRIADWGT